MTVDRSMLRKALLGFIAALVIAPPVAQASRPQGGLQHTYVGSIGVNEGIH